MIYSKQIFDKEMVLNDINKWLLDVELSPIPNDNIINFIKINFNKYKFFTNTSLPSESLNKIFTSLSIKDYFVELLSYDTWDKTENINYVINKYNILPNDILFIDDNINNINTVKHLGVNLLHYNNLNINLHKYV
jgi:phosphoglycolate phosphatase-like HAD superfamily hydrolase